MRFFVRRSTVDRGKVWSLLHSITDIDHNGKDMKPGLEAIENIVNSALSGSLDVNQTDFQLVAYDRVSVKRTKLSKAFYRDAHIANDGDVNEEGFAKAGTIVESKALASFENAFQEIDGTEAARESIIALVALRDRLRVEVGIDPLASLLSGLEGNLEGSQNIVNLCNHSDDVKELLIDLLESSKDLNGSSDFQLADVIREHAPDLS